MPNKKSTRRYTTPMDFLADPSFYFFFSRYHQTNYNFWLNYRGKYKRKRAAIDTALECLRTPDKRKEILQQYFDNIRQRRRKIFLKTLKYTGIAATLFLLIAGTYLYITRNHILYNTGYGEVKTVILPDGSKVLLNANSRLRISGKWQPGDTRKVWLKGEGFFTVLPVLNAGPFIVKSDEADIELTATEFNLKDRPNGAAIFVRSGQLKVSLNGKKAVELSPGQLIVYDEESNHTGVAKADAMQQLAWTEGRMVFNGATIQDIAVSFKDLYGKKVLPDGHMIHNLEFKGNVRAENLEVLLKAMEDTFHLYTQQSPRYILMRVRGTEAR